MTSAYANLSVQQSSLQAQVPQLKRRLEQLLIMTKGLLQYSGAVQHILVGNLRHKDLAGQVVPSQAYRESSSEEESDGEEDDAEHEPAPGISLLTCPYISALRTNTRMHALHALTRVKLIYMYPARALAGRGLAGEWMDCRLQCLAAFSYMHPCGRLALQ